MVLKLWRDLVPMSADAANVEVSMCCSLSVSVIRKYSATEVCKSLSCHVVCLMGEGRRKM